MLCSKQTFRIVCAAQDIVPHVYAYYVRDTLAFKCRQCGLHGLGHTPRPAAALAHLTHEYTTGGVSIKYSTGGVFSITAIFMPLPTTFPTLRICWFRVVRRQRAAYSSSSCCSPWLHLSFSAFAASLSSLVCEWDVVITFEARETFRQTDTRTPILGRCVSSVYTRCAFFCRRHLMG